MNTYDLKVGYACNNRCKHCVIAGMKRRLIKNNQKIDLSTEECLSQLDEQVKINHIERVVLTGGEITVRSDFETIIDECIKHNLEISIQSNGRLFRKNEYVDIVSKCPAIDFAIALHGDNALTHDKITCVSGSFAETCEGIRKLSERGLEVTVKVVISKFNQNELANIVGLAKSLGAFDVNYAFPHALGDAKVNFDDVVPTYTSLVNELKKTIKKSEELDLPINFETIPLCYIPDRIDLSSEILFFNNDNDTFCTQVHENTYEWNAKRKEIKKKSPNCQECYLNHWCEGVWSEYYEHFGGEELIPFSKTNELEELLKKYGLIKS